MLLRSLGDEDDEVRDRAVLLVQTLSQLQPASSSTAIEDGEDGEDPAASALSPEEVRDRCCCDDPGSFIMVVLALVFPGGAALSAG